MSFSSSIAVKKPPNRRSGPFQPGVLDAVHGRITQCGVIGFIGGILCLTIPITTASGIDISDLVINRSRENLMLTIVVNDNIRETVDTPTEGVSATILFSIALYEVKAFWFDKQIARHTATNIVKHYPVENEYWLLRSWENGPPLVLDSVTQVRQLMTEVRNLKVIPLDLLKEGCRYQLRVRAVCRENDTFLCKSPEGFYSDWHTVDFVF